MKEYKKIKAGVRLYRYDVVEPPKGGWFKYFNSPLYKYYEGEYRPKNEIGAFFFFDNMDDAIEVGKNAIVQRNDIIKEYNPKLDLWITESYNKEELNMFDISDCTDVDDLYVRLWDDGLSIFEGDFYKFSFWGSESLSILKDDVRYLSLHKGENTSYDYNKHKYNIINFFNNCDDENRLPYACQLLTDFCNGVSFKTMLEAKGIEGYLFKEANGNAYCVFDSQKLAIPQTHILSVTL